MMWVPWIGFGLGVAGIWLLRLKTGGGKTSPGYGPASAQRNRRMGRLVRRMQDISPLVRFRVRMQRERTDREIFEAISFLRNIIAADRGGRIGTDTLLEHLAAREGELRPVFLKTLSLLRVNKKDEMIQAFSQMSGTAMGRDFIRMLVGWDNVSPEKLSSTLLSYQSAMKESRTTELKRRNEVLSDLAFFPVVTNVLVVFMNFIFIAYFIGQRDLIQQLFF